MSSNTLLLALWKTLRTMVLYILPPLLVLLVLTPFHHGYAYDFKIFRTAGNAYLHGHSPYPPPKLAVLQRQHSFVYPAPMALLFAPFALLPWKVGAVLFECGLVACVAGTLRLLRVRDWRLYSIAFLLLPVELGIRLGTISPLLALLVAALWRYRDRTLPAALLLAAIIVSKLFLAPLAVWLLVTRRWRAAVLGSAVALVATLAAWSVIGFAGFSDYRRILSLLATGEERESFSLASLGFAGGLSAHVSHLIAEGVGAVLLVAAIGVGLRLRSRRGDFTAFTLVIGGALAVSPIVWNHYFAVLLIPLAVVAPRLSPIWAVPFLLWFVPAQSYHQFVLIAVGVVAPAIALGWAIRHAWSDPEARLAENGLQTNV
ncbi:MAG: glycosyltransferase family 87 protein [Gaiellaceae bacterium]